MSNTLFVTQETLWGGVDIYINNMTTAMVATPFTNANNQSSLGQTINLRYPIPMKGEVGLDPTYQQNIVQRVLPVTWGTSTSAVVQFPLGMLDTSFSIAVNDPNAFFDEYINKNLVVQLANQNAFRLMERMELAFSDSIGSPTQVVSGLQVLTQMNSQFGNMGLDISQNGQKYAAFSPNAAGTLQLPYASYFDQNFLDPILRENTNKLGVFSGIQCYMDQFVTFSLTHQNGDWWNSLTNPVIAAISAPAGVPGTGTDNINNAYTVLSLTGCVNNSTVKKGDLITIKSQNAPTVGQVIQQINQSVFLPFGNPKTLVVQEDASVDGSGNVDIKVTTIVNEGAGQTWQNVSIPVQVDDTVQLVAGNSAVYVKNPCFPKQAILFGNPPLWPTPIGTGKQGDAPAGLRGYPGQFQVNHRIKQNGMNIAYLLTTQAQGTSTVLFTGQTICIPAAYNGYGFMYLSAA